MALNYHEPETVINPAEYITGISVLYDGGVNGFSLARFRCDGTDHIGMRWNVARKEYDDPEKQAGNIKCLGTPSVKGVPSWFILPRELFHPDLFDKNNMQFLNVLQQWKK